jgi:polyvinyl alcohol dehydrogenase (cytochrome)
LKRLLLLLLVFSCAGVAQNGVPVYQKHCAMCHDAPKGRTPSVDALKKMSATAILRALDAGVMRQQASGLSTQERADVAEYLAVGESNSARTVASQSGVGYCKASTDPSRTAVKSDWNGFGAGVTNARFQSDAGLSVGDVPKLQLRWAFGLGDVTNARGQPIIVGGRVFAASAAGKVYALDAKSGCLYWVFDADAPVRSGVLAGPSSVYFGDAKANAYGVDIGSGKLVWKSHLEEHPAAVITDTPNLADGVLFFGVSSYEELIGQKADYECCSFRGSVVAVDAATGKTKWKSYTIAEESKPTKKTQAGLQRRGPSGAGIWSTPTVDVKRNAVYVSTGDNYSDPTTATSDALLALDRGTGKVLWSRQMTANDAYNLGCEGAANDNCPGAKGPDFDFGQPPILVSLPNGTQELVIAQKSGMAYAVDPDQQGKILWQARVGKGGSLGGSQWGSAADDHSMYVAISDIAFRPVKDATSAAINFEVDPEKGGGVFALDLLSGKTTWSALPKSCGEKKNCGPAQLAAVSAIPGVVFEGSMDGHLRGYSSSSGDVIWDFDTAREYETVNGQKARGGSIDGGGAAIAGGMVYVYSGYSQWGGMPGNVLLAFSVDGK